MGLLKEFFTALLLAVLLMLWLGCILVMVTVISALLVLTF